jgi:uncharacterized protein YecE (DUF72 family)
VGLIVGTSGWQYRDWKGAFYPRELAQKAWLEHYAERFPVVEVNNTFYRLPERKTFEGWAARTPDDFCFVIKASRYLTHVRRLQEPREPVERLVGAARGLGSKLGPVLVQLPPNLRLELDRLAATLEEFARHEVRIALEVRHPTWLVDEVFELLARHDVALVLADRAGRRDEVRRTASWGYVRLHEGTASPRPCYGDAALRSWADRIGDTWAPADDVYVFFNNDPRACAVRNAMRFSELAARTQR